MKQFKRMIKGEILKKVEKEVRMTRIRRFIDTHRLFFFISKLVLISYLLLFTLTYLNTATGAVFTESYTVVSNIHAEAEEEVIVEENEPEEEKDMEEEQRIGEVKEKIQKK
ncbi:hypothetical protein [Oceanobacillus sp. HCA-5259]|uniref:hypothetical protein n=1 Tax=Oceanobacillus sp. HCA-5259 TaxID=3134661 RepID=UPI0030ECE4E9